MTEKNRTKPKKRTSGTRKRRKRRKGTSPVVSIVFIVFCMFITYAIYTKNQEELETPVKSNLIENDYDYSNLETDGVFKYYEDENYTSKVGIDVSDHQGVIDWKKVKKAGIEFAFIRCGYRGYETGLINADTQFDYNMEEALANGIEVGVYFFSQATSQEEAKEEAKFTLECIRKYNVTLPVVYDFEKPGGITARTFSQSKDVTTENAVLFGHLVQRKGYTAMIYNSTNLFEKLFNMEYIQEFKTWVAHYNTPYPTYPYTYQIWQYSDSGVIDGIEQPVDMDLLFVPKNNL